MFGRGLYGKRFKESCGFRMDKANERLLQIVKHPAVFMHLLVLAMFTAVTMNVALAQDVQIATQAAEDTRQLDSSLLKNQEAFVKLENALLKTLEATTVSAEVSGRLSDWKVQEGHRISQGQLLGKVNDRAASIQLQQMKTALDRARLKHKSDVELRLAESRTEVSKNELERAIAANTRIADTFPLKEVERLKLLHQTNLLEVERAQQDRQVGALEVIQAEDQFRAAEELVQRHQIRSPVDGVIVSVRRRLGEWVEPGAEVLQIVNLDRLRIEGFVPAISSAEIEIGCSASVILTVGKEQIRREAKVSFVGHEVNPATGQIRIFLELPNSDLSLKPGMRAQAQIKVDELKHE